MGKPATVTYRANDEDQTCDLAGGSFRIGRDPDCDLTVDNPYISRHTPRSPRSAAFIRFVTWTALRAPT